MKTPARRAFTMYQLLVLLALLALLAAFLFPVIARVRMSAARASSQNNLKQLGLACHNYHDVNGALPPGVNDKHFSATALLLPYIEQDNLYKQIDFNKDVDDKANATIRATLVRTFMSPSDPQMVVSRDYGPTNYLFNAGNKPALKNNNGVFYLDSKVKLTDIVDGTSNTLMVGETLKGDGKPGGDVRRHHVRLKAAALEKADAETGVNDFKNGKNVVANRCASWMDGRFLQGTFTGTRSANDDKPDVDCGGDGGLSALRSVSNGVNVGLCDGSVRFLDNKVSLDTWKLLAQRDDGQALPADF